MSELSKQIVSKNSSYADDLKLFFPSFLSASLQSDINFIADWASRNGLELNHDKCVVMYFGNNNPHHTYYIQAKTIAAKPSHVDLGILVDSSLKFQAHADFIVNKVIKKAHYILKSFSRLSSHLFGILFRTFLRPVLEYCSQVSRPCYASSLARLETCQRRLTKWCKPLKHLPYSVRLERLNLPSVENRMKRGDLILTYQILNQLIDLNPCDFFCFASTNTRGHNFRLSGTTSNLNIRHRFFTERIVQIWNSLPHHIVEAPTLNSFKSRLDSLG